MFIALYTLIVHLGVLATDLHILRLVRGHCAVENEEQIQIRWYSAFSGGPAIFLEAQLGLCVKTLVRLVGIHLPCW
jgi:hypothetical protein